MHINSAFSVLAQLGVGPKEGFFIEDSSASWSDYIDENANLEFIKIYIYLKVKSAFDPPTSSSAMDAINRQLSELEWRINVAVD